MNPLAQISNQRKITFVTLFFCFIFVILIGASEFKNNYLNYSIALSFTGSFLFLKSLIYTILSGEKNLKNNNWFSFGLDIVFFFSQTWLIIQGIRYLNQTSDPFNCVWYFFMAVILFFAQIYIAKFLTFLKNQLFEVVVFGLSVGSLRTLTIYTPDNQTYLLMQVFFGYTVFFISCFSYFNLLKNLMKK